MLNKLMIKLLYWYFPNIDCKNIELKKCCGDQEIKIIDFQNHIADLKKLLNNNYEEIEELRRLLYNQHEVVPDKTDPLIKVRSQEGWKSINELPKYSIPECIVSDGEIVQCVQYDHNTKSFLKCFGSQSMYVRKPTAWMPMPLPPAKTNGYLETHQRASSRIAHTYNR